jgi:hypothetical protein
MQPHCLPFPILTAPFSYLSTHNVRKDNDVANLNSLTIFFENFVDWTSPAVFSKLIFMYFSVEQIPPEPATSRTLLLMNFSFEQTSPEPIVSLKFLHARKSQAIL